MNQPEHRVFHSMGIPIHITLVGCSATEADHAAQKAEAIFNEYDLRFSRFKNESELMSLNNSNGVWHKVSLPLFQVLKKCVALSADTMGIFDASVGGILASYGYGLPKKFIRKTPFPTYRDLAFNDRELLVRLAPGQILEPACIVKGMSIDAAGQALSEVRGFMINAGGDILTHGSFNNGSAWNIAIQDPRDLRAIVTTIGIKNAGIATSGIYQTGGEHDGEKWHHLINMQTGKPANRTMSATVIAPTCEQADIEASLAILLPFEQTVARLEQRKLPYFLIYNDGHIAKNAAFSALEVPFDKIATDTV
ncbi:MAG: Thiamine biosynthesis lipoprotein ApbE [Candidatus Azambacteria bacterium GW2011_GWA1_44_9]|uniref:FAD:protein FMN transferase n=2 Tax=Parcubacteria group TaxID=1794811 RepID=A0A0G1MN63_9BACT|nr:MAG: Thiamine biosynthesis lipoprotein ApbE [Candidatus Azambacteria bacterium GW2011_GWA1_44_9]